MTLPDGCLGAARRHALPRRRSTRSSRSPRSGRATPSSPASSRPATAAAPGDECLRFAVACGAESTQHFGAGVLDPREVERLRSARSQVEALEAPAVQPSPKLGCRHGSRDRPGQEGPPRLRLRRHRDRPVAPHARPGRHRHHLDARALPLRAAAARLGDGRRRLAPDRRHRRQARRPGGAQPRGHLHPLRGRRGAARAHRRAPQGGGHGGDAAHLRRADQAGADRAADPRDQGPGRRRRRLAHPPARARALRDRARGRPRHPRDPGHGHLGRARLHRRVAAAAQPQGVHPRGAGAGGRRRLRLLLHRPPPHAHRRRGRARGRRPGRRLHHARRARHRRPAGHRDRRRARPPARSTCSRRAST